MKNILIVQGGGRPNGNMAQLVNGFIAGVKESGHSIELISLTKNEVKGCLGCNACRYGKPCIQKELLCQRKLFTSRASDTIAISLFYTTAGTSPIVSDMGIPKI